LSSFICDIKTRQGLINIKQDIAYIYYV
jgi:hypothetical protein